MGKSKGNFSWKKKGKLWRGMGILLAAALVLNTLSLGGLEASAAEAEEYSGVYEAGGGVSGGDYVEDTGFCAHHREHTADCGYSSVSGNGAGTPCEYACPICPLEDLIAVLPYEVTGDNVEEVGALLDEIFARYEALTEEEQQTDLSRCLELLEALEGMEQTLLALEAVSYLDCDENGQNWQTKDCEDYTEITSDSTTWSDGWYVVRGEVTISSRITVSGDVKLILADNCTLNAEKGIRVTRGNNFTIYAQSDGESAGCLTATGASNPYAGIGGDGDSGTIIINGGVINAQGGGNTKRTSFGSAGIGGGGGLNNKSGGTTIINGGVVTAIGGNGGSANAAGAGIGGASFGSGGTIIINGGTVDAREGTGGGGASGIGDGGKNVEHSAAIITITGGTVTASSFSDNSTITITGGTINGKTYYTVVFDKNGMDIEIPTQCVGGGDKVTEPGTEGYIVVWYTDQECSNAYDFDTPVASNITLYAKWTENKDYLASVQFDDGTAQNYTTLSAAWSALAGQAGTITLLRDVTTEDRLVVSSGMDVTVEMAEGVTFTNTAADCFKVDGGTLTLASGTALEQDSARSVVYAASGTLRITGGRYESTGNGLWIDKNVAVALSGGTITASNYALRYDGHKVRDMLDRTLGDEVCIAFYDGRGNLVTSDFALDYSTSYKNSTYTVKADSHSYQWRQGSREGHYQHCTVCNRETASEPHNFQDGVCTVCNASYVACVEVDGAVTNCISLHEAWELAQGKETTLTILKNQSLTDNMKMTDANTNLTVEAVEGVTVQSTSDFFVVEAGKLTLNSGTFISSGYGKSGIYMTNGDVVMNGGKIKMTGDNLVYDTKCIRVNGSGRLTISGGTLEMVASSYGDKAHTVLLVDQGTVILTGGTFINPGKKTVRVTAEGQSIGSLLGENYAFYDKDGKLLTSGLEGKELASGTYTVKECSHLNQYSHIDNTTTHDRVCSGCGLTVNGEPCHYEWTDGNATAECICGSALTVSVGAEAMVYDGGEKKPEITVTLTDGTEERKLTEGIEYERSFTNNINAGNGALVTVIGKTYEGTFAQDFEIARATPDLGAVTAEELENTLDGAQVALSREKNTPAGTLKLADDTELQYGRNTYEWEFIPDDTANYNAVTGEVEITVKDTLVPTASYQVETDGWKKFANTITFGLFSKDYKVVEIRYTDDTDSITGSGIAESLYYISDHYLTNEEIADGDSMAWETYAAPICLDAEGVYFIYVKVSDKAGNKAIYNSEGIVIYTESALSPAAIDYTYKQNRDCVIQLDENGNTFSRLADSNGDTVGAEYYEVDDSGRLTLKAEGLDRLDKGEYTYKVYMNPQGVETQEVVLAYTFTVNVKAAELTVRGAEAADRVYDGTKLVDITAVTLSGIAPGDDVTVDLSKVQGTLSSADVGTYTLVTLPELILTGAAKDNYTLMQPTEAVPATVAIRRADAEILVETREYHKSFGDPDFPLNGITDTNTDEEVQYVVTAGTDVVSVSDGVVTIRNAGTAEITVSLPESANYNAAESKTITVYVAKNGAYTAVVSNRSYLYSKENTDSIDLAGLLPRDCKTIAYGEPVTEGNVTYMTAPAVKDGKLSYTINQGAIDDQGTITVVVETRNYEDIELTVNVKLTDRLPVHLKEGTEIALKEDTLNYGEALSKLLFDTAVFIDDSGKTVTGRLTWKDGAATPDAGAISAAWVFVPTDAMYLPAEGTVDITVNRAVPVVSALPTVKRRVYDPSVTLDGVELSGGNATWTVGGSTVTVEGAWSWKDTSVVPEADNSGYAAVFTPADTKNYEVVTVTVLVTVAKAVPYIVAPPTAAGITYGDALSASALSGGAVLYGNGTGQAGSEAGSDEAIEGSFTWEEPSAKPTVADSGRREYTVVFIPLDTANYEAVKCRLTLTVQKAENAPNMPGSAMTATIDIQLMLADVSLAAYADWEWENGQMALPSEAGAVVTATARYTGADQDNYSNVTREITITMVKDSHVTVVPDKESSTRVIMYEGIREIPQALADAGFDTEEKILEALSRVVLQSGGYAKGNMVTYDIELQISTDGGKTWVNATKENFPAEGLTLTIPYPMGTAQSGYEFRVVHMFTHAVNGHQPGETETPEVTNTAEGIRFTVLGLSPITIAWKATGQTPGAGDAPGTTEPGTTEPGTTEPGTTEPGMTEPGTTEPGATEPGTTLPESSDSGNVNIGILDGQNEAVYAPQTGDDRHPWLSLLLLAASGMGIAAAIITAKKKKAY